jgi:tetratricopeptide (TPR) repeat protein
MGYRIGIIILLFFPILTGSASALDLDSSYLIEIRRGIDLTLTERFDEARQTFQAMIDRDSTDHAARLFLAGVYHSEMFDREDFGGHHRFEKLADEAIRLADKAIRENRNPAWAYLTKGNAYAYIATLDTRIGSWWSALRKGLAAKSEYLEALKIDPRLIDAYLGLGSYHYWKSAKTEFINWIPLIPDRREDGIAELKLAMDSASFSRDLAANSLVWIYLDCGEYGNAYAIASRLHRKFPHSRLFTWGLAFSAYYSRNLEEAAECFGRILNVIESEPGQNNFNAIECRYHRAEIFRAQHQNDKAVLELTALLSYPVSEEIKNRQKDKLSRARELLKQLQK